MDVAYCKYFALSWVRNAKLPPLLEKAMPECNKTPKEAEASEARNTDDAPFDTSSLSMFRNVGRSYKTAYIRKNTLCYILLSLAMHPTSFAVMWCFMDVPFLVIPCLYCVIAVILGVRAIKLMETNRIPRAYIITFALLNFSILLGMSGFELVIQMLRYTARHII